MTGRPVADQQWCGHWVAAADLPAVPDAVRLPGTVVPGLRDHHVHLGLVDAGALADSVLSEVDDLGWSLDGALALRARATGGRRIRIAGPFLTASGGYPVGRSWAPPGTVLELPTPAVGARTVRELVAAGVDQIKVSLHTGMPLLDDAVLAAVVATAHAAGRPVVAHSEGPGQAVRALAAGVDTLAHAPFSEQLPDRTLAAMVRAGMTWISTLALHGTGPGARVPGDNVRRFVAAGGRLRYGTDLGNGHGPVDLRTDEIAALARAGLSVAAILGAVAVAADADHLTWTPHPPPADPAALPEWCATLRRIPTTEIGSLL